MVLEPRVHRDDLEAAPHGRLMVAILTPTGAVASRAADELVAPGVLGEFGVLPGHIPFLSAIRPGVLKLRDGAGRMIAAVGAGYVQVGSENKVRVLIDRLAKPEDIDVAAARADLENYGAQLKETTATGSDLAALEKKVAWARARLDAVEQANIAAHG
jgi:F-type H+-transporting ATPase subunit epsilon